MSCFTQGTNCRSQDGKEIIGQLNTIIEQLICPISHVVMEQPVTIESGHTFDRACIEAWFKRGHHTNPQTNLSLRSLKLYPNIRIKNIISKLPGARQKIIKEKRNLQELLICIQKIWNEDQTPGHEVDKIVTKQVKRLQGENKQLHQQLQIKIQENLKAQKQIKQQLQRYMDSNIDLTRQNKILKETLFQFKQKINTLNKQNMKKTQQLQKMTIQILTKDKQLKQLRGKQPPTEAINLNNTINRQTQTQQNFNRQIQNPVVVHQCTKQIMSQNYIGKAGHKTIKIHNTNINSKHQGSIFNANLYKNNNTKKTNNQVVNQIKKSNQQADSNKKTGPKTKSTQRFVNKTMSGIKLRNPKAQLNQKQKHKIILNRTQKNNSIRQQSYSQLIQDSQNNINYDPFQDHLLYHTQHDCSQPSLKKNFSTRKVANKSQRR